MLQQGLSDPEFYGDLAVIEKIYISKADFSDQFRKIITRYSCIFSAKPSYG